MKWVLVDKLDNINTSAELHSGLGDKAAKEYFMDVKILDERNFDHLWKVMSSNEYDKRMEASLRGPSSNEGSQGINVSQQIEWWKEEKEIIDDELKLF